MNNEPKVSQNRLKKEVIVSEVSEKMQKSVALVFTNYQGVTHQQLEGLKKGLKSADAEFAVVKNTLVKRALEANKLPINEEQLNLPTAALFAYTDPISPLKELTKKMKEFGALTIKFGILDGELLNESQVQQLATLPTKEVLLAQLVGTLKSPIYGLHRSLNWNIQKFVMTVQAVANSKTS